MESTRLDNYRPEASGNYGSDREERLLRLVDIMRTQQARVSVVPNAHGPGRNFRRWRVLGGLVIVMVAAGVLLHASGPWSFRSDATPDPMAGTASVPPALQQILLGPPAPSAITAQSELQEAVVTTDAATNAAINLAPTRPVPEVLSSSDPGGSGSAPAEQNLMDPPAAVEAPAAQAAPPAAPQQEATAAESPDRKTLDAARSEPVKPALFIYYPQQSRHAAADARSLSARIGSSLANVNVAARTGVPDDAVVKYSMERDHAQARIIGETLGDLGYRWKIERVALPIIPRGNMIEVWLPMK